MKKFQKCLKPNFLITQIFFLKGQGLAFIVYPYAGKFFIK